MDPPAPLPSTSAEPQQREEPEQRPQSSQSRRPESSGSRGWQPAQGEMSTPPIAAKPVLRLSEGPHPAVRTVPAVPSNMSLGYADRLEGEILTVPGLQKGEGPFPSEPRVSRRATGERVYDRTRTGDSARRSAIDWVVPVEERSIQRHTVEERLRPTLEHASRKRDELKRSAQITKWGINFAVGLQVFLGALTTGVAAIQLNGKQLGVATTVLGILTTLTGAFLGRVRSTEEPETSLIRARDIDSFVRRCEAYCLDYGHEVGERTDDQVENFRHQFEGLLGKGPPPLATTNFEDKSKQTVAV